MRLSDLARGFDITGGNPDVTGLTEDSRRIRPGMLFVAVRGTALDGHAYVGDAVARGAAAIAAERLDGVPPGMATVCVESGRRALATFAARFYEEPARDLRLIGFTGTFGKTSTSEILRALLEAEGARPGVLGSLGARFGTFHDPGTGLTTPAPVELHRALRALGAAGADSVIMEVTSHALRMGRVDGLRFSGGLLAAIRPGEHTDFHHSYAHYVEAKRLFLQYLSADALLAYDADNRAARQLAAEARVARTAGFTLAGRDADLIFYDVVVDAAGARFTIEGSLAPGRRTLQSALLGRGHLRNVALALTYALGAGVSLDAAERVLRTLSPLRRRMERYAAGGRTVLDDTAAHPESLAATLEVAAMLPHERTALVYAVRGSRGADINRRNALALADLSAEHGVETLVITSAEDVTGPADRVTPEEASAVKDALHERGRHFVWRDTLRDAIDGALAATRPGDVIVLVGAQGMNAGREIVETGGGR
jgi:UDP-N-acetylmuramoyl-L-alanyl-D-glutamate--2,6-diaminopimelate ligase